MEANQLTAEELAAIRETYEEFGAHEYPVGRLLATVEAALLSIEDQAAIIADRDATVEALRAENERLREQRDTIVTTIRQSRLDSIGGERNTYEPQIGKAWLARVLGEEPEA